MESPDAEIDVDSGEVEEVEAPAAHQEYQTLAHGVLSPRHRRLAQLAAEGRSNQDICRELGYVGSRVSVLLRNPHVAAEVTRLQERIFEETIESRLKSFAEPALSNIHMILTDRTNRVKISEKMALSQWVIEKLDGKATQKVDVGGNLLSALMDRLDASRTVVHNHLHVSAEATENPPALKDVTQRVTEPQAQISAAPSEENDLEAWIRDFDQSSQAK